MGKRKEEEMATWEDDQDDETKETEIVRAPNNKLYKIRVISAYDRQKIQSAATKFQLEGRRGKRGKAGAKMEMQTVLMNALTLQKGVIKPDFSKRNIEEIESWMKKKKDGVVTYLMDQIAYLSGYSALDVEEDYFRDEVTESSRS